MPPTPCIAHAKKDAPSDLSDALFEPSSALSELSANHRALRTRSARCQLPTQFYCVAGGGPHRRCRPPTTCGEAQLPRGSMRSLPSAWERGQIRTGALGGDAEFRLAGRRRVKMLSAMSSSCAACTSPSGAAAAFRLRLSAPRRCREGWSRRIPDQIQREQTEIDEMIAPLITK
jgi:hypothetical protein